MSSSMKGAADFADDAGDRDNVDSDEEDYSDFSHDGWLTAAASQGDVGTS